MDIKVFRHYNYETNEVQYDFNTELPRRPHFNTAGKEIKIGLNSFPITKYPTSTVYQYDVLIGSGTEKRGLIQKVWDSKTVQAKLNHPSWIFDGNRIAWAMQDHEDRVLQLTVDLDAEAGRPPRAAGDNKHRFVMKKTSSINLAVIDAYLQGKMSFDNSVLQAINFMDHLLRNWPSKNLLTIKQSYFHRGAARFDLGRGVEAFKGVYQTIRACQGGLNINADVSNGTFWLEVSLAGMGIILTETHGYGGLRVIMEGRPDDIDPKKIVKSPHERMLHRLEKIAIYPLGLPDGKLRYRTFYIKGFRKENAKTYKFDVRDKETGEITKDVSVFDYFLKKYDIWLEHHYLPLVETTKKGTVFPMEIMAIQRDQRYNFKLDEMQTSKMIKFAVTRPDKRMEHINYGLDLLKWTEDPYLKGYGMEISRDMVQTKARLLPPPVVQFKGSQASPGTSGRWDLKGPKKFLLPNPVPLKSWGVLIYKLGPPIYKKDIERARVDMFIREFVKTYQSHGGIVQHRMPTILEGISDPADGALKLFEKVSSEGNGPPQILMFILADKTAFHYSRVKKSCDCRFGVVSQCVQSAHVEKANTQYMSNVCMKFNAKLGGTTARVAGRNPILGHFTKPSIMIGADVSHPAPMSDAPSMAALTCSLDKIGVRFSAAVETNGYRVEMISPESFRTMLLPLVDHWVVNVNGGVAPEHIYYFRDGVSEGQYQHVLQRELKDLRAALKLKAPKWDPKFVVIVASKRHHIRFFPNPKDMKASDRNGNPLPGTVVERDVTHPHEHDFYMCSHSAIQGTARPVHYHVLLDEIGLSVNYLHTLIYEQCYSYIRSTTPVSLHPAVYYAHLASNRGRAHENVPASSGPRTTPLLKELKAREKAKEKAELRAHLTGTKLSEPKKPPTEEPPLLPMPNNLQLEMWYV
ncbi:MAG: hypothetical protein M1833_004722 [Piccolia ochrophora]|nr:MAG: hypothetical protein M1833_004722 [Piccolia ochrophora]